MKTWQYQDPGNGVQPEVVSQVALETGVLYPSNQREFHLNNRINHSHQ